MAKIKELENAIGAHGIWKTRLLQAIETGKIDASIETIRMDNQCTFGKWLFGPSLLAADKLSNHYLKVKDLHAEFHKTAALVAELAIAGKTEEALKMIERGGNYSIISSKLTVAMLEWKKVSE